MKLNEKKSPLEGLKTAYNNMRLNLGILVIQGLIHYWYIIWGASDMVERRVEVVGRLKVLEESAAPLISFLQNPALVQELRADKHYNLQMLQDRYQVGFSSDNNYLFCWRNFFFVGINWFTSYS